ncbi:MAG: choline dehydrogenase [Proteobacteria bacterium TMED51]|nr:MAG: choline dehydrogenase [Proteobacteria bacterium TMED51]
MEFDYVIVGGGSAGCALAARLAENREARVCLIEAGGKGRNLFIRMPAGNGLVFGNAKLDWGFESVPQPALNDRKIYFPRGRALGGSSIMNGMIYIRGVPQDYDAWRESGLSGWGFSDLLPYFRRSQGAVDRKGVWHGVDGPVKTEASVNFGELEEAFIEAAVACGHQRLDDFNGLHRAGVGRTDSTVHRGIRQSSAISYLAKRPSNLKILTHRQAVRVILEGGVAKGIETLGKEKIYAREEVILCQGAFGTPQTLMLSGIGPAAHLSQHGINAVVDLPGVGQSLADHVDVSMQYGSDRMDLSLARHQRLDRAAWLMARWLFNGSGPGGGAFFSSVIFHGLNDPVMPEFETFMTPMTVHENMTDGDVEKAPLMQRLGRHLLVRGRQVAKPGVQIDINLERPKSLGTVCLASANPLDPPRIDPRFFSHTDDLNAMVAGVKTMREIMAQPEIAKYVTGEIGAWQRAKTDAQIIEAIRQTAYTGHHPCSSAKMGPDKDPLAVLDSELRVRGVDKLRVCDASAMPSQITGNLNATVIAMAERGADLILGKTPLVPADPRI